MTARDRGFLLLTGYLGDPDRHPLTVAQFRELTQRSRAMEKPLEDRQLRQEDLVNIGCSPAFSNRVLKLLSDEEQLDWYLETGERQNCKAITRLQEAYPYRLRTCLGLDAPACIWVKGNTELLYKEKVALVGSRELYPENTDFAENVGKQAALQGYVLVSGNARGADRIAQESCLAHGGDVISIVADELGKKPLSNHVLYLSEDGFDLPFLSARALSRNRLIHSLTEKTFVAQCSLEKVEHGMELCVICSLTGAQCFALMTARMCVENCSVAEQNWLKQRTLSILRLYMMI